MRCTSIVVALTIVVIASLAQASVPTSISVQGRLTDSTGFPLPAGDKDFTFKIYDAQIGGTEIWPGGLGEEQSIFTDDNGIWSAFVGAANPLPDSVFGDTVRWLEITVDDGTKSLAPIMLPRVRLVTGPYAYRVGTVDGALGGNITSPISVGEGHTLGAASIVTGSSNLATGNAGTSAIIGGSGNTMDGFASMIAADSGNSVSNNHALSPDAEQCGILFGSPTNSLMGSTRFSPSGADRGFHFRCGYNDIRLVLDSLGNLTADGCVSGSNLACPSDRRFKTNTETLTDATLSIEKLRGVRYEWRRDEFPDREFADGEQIGLIAQEVLDLVPQAVIEQSDGYLAVDYSRLLPLLIEGMKEQQAEIDELRLIIEQISQ